MTHGHLADPARDWPKYVEVMEGFGQHWKALAAILVLSGARIDEALVLKWSDVKWDNAHIEISRIWEPRTGEIKDRTKGLRDGGTEPVLLLPELKKILREHRMKSAYDKESHFIVCDAWGKHYTYWQAYRIHNLAIEAGKFPKITLHGMRHTAGRYFRSLGFQGDDLKGLMRHKDSKTTEGYAPIDMRHLVERSVQLGLEMDGGA